MHIHLRARGHPRVQFCVCLQTYITMYIYLCVYTYMYLCIYTTCMYIYLGARGASTYIYNHVYISVCMYVAYVPELRWKKDEPRYVWSSTSSNILSNRENDVKGCCGYARRLTKRPQMCEYMHVTGAYVPELSWKKDEAYLVRAYVWNISDNFFCHG